MAVCLVDPAVHFQWARDTVVEEVRRKSGFRRESQEVFDLEQTAYLSLVKAAETFDSSRVESGCDLGDYFRKVVYRTVKTEVIREARRLKNGGMYRTRDERGKRRMQVQYLSQMTGPCDEAFELPDPTSLEDED